MEAFLVRRTTPLILVLLCSAAFLTVVSSAPFSSPFLATSSRLGSVFTPAFAAQAAEPLVWEGKTVYKYVTKLRPTTLNGKVVGDKGARGKYVTKIMRFSATTYYAESVISVLNINSGGKELTIRVATSCTGLSQDITAQWTNITSNKTGRRKRYSFVFTYTDGPKSLAKLREQTEGVFKALGDYTQVGHANNENALCGQFKKVKVK
ncbi:unnamed protein product [Closterium sp. Naga37s-1]|nr:unnamed protein product [Closterium sp. Naga37s-1]